MALQVASKPDLVWFVVEVVVGAAEQDKTNVVGRDFKDVFIIRGADMVDHIGNNSRVSVFAFIG